MQCKAVDRCQGEALEGAAPTVGTRRRVGEDTTRDATIGEATAIIQTDQVVEASWDQVAANTIVVESDNEPLKC